MTEFYCIITDKGLSKLANAKISGNSTILTQMAVGDGKGEYYNPQAEQTKLVNEKYRFDINRIYIDVNNYKQLLIEGSLPDVVGGFFIREIGVFDNEGDLFAIGKYPVTYKPSSESGSGKDIYVRMGLLFSNAPNTIMYMNQSSAVASIDTVETMLEQLNHNDLKDAQGGKKNQYYHINALEHGTFLALLELLSEENAGKNISVGSDGKGFSLSSSMDEISQSIEEMAGNVIKVKKSFSIYKKTITGATSFSFDLSEIGEIGNDKVITIELFVVMSGVFSITMPANISWVNNIQPLMNKAAKYLLAFRSFDKGVTWITNIQARWT
ncbi:MAG: phage tail protein [Alphaproteobacteria bacterium]|nr:phage tail protein [Alphaproteobacteria bacterium]